MRLKRVYIYAATFFLIIILLFISGESILRKIGAFLLVEKRPEKSDVIVILRGDPSYSRALEGAQLFKEGYAERILISSALFDNYAKRLKQFGIDIPTEQETLVTVFTDLGIPKKRIVLDDRKPGGGTVGEAKRIMYKMTEMGFESAIVVTTWEHTRRVNNILRRLSKDKGLRFFVVSARDDISSPLNWWKYRYEALGVLEELFKLVAFNLSGIFELSFDDDPAEKDAVTHGNKRTQIL